jgi:hypothetical protein
MTLARPLALTLAVLASCSFPTALQSVPAPADAGDAAPDVLVALSPKALGQRLVFWFDPTSLVVQEGRVVRWKDLSDSGNDAVQPVPGFQPVLGAASIAGLPAARFGGPVTFLRSYDNPSLQWGRDDFLVLVVERATAATTAANAMLYQKTGDAPYDGASLYLNANKPLTTKLAAGQVSGGTYVVSSAPPATFVDGNVHLLGVHRSGPSLEVRVDGTVSSSLVNARVGSTDVSAPGFDAIIGHNGYNPRPEFQQLHGDIAEMVAIRGPLSASELAGLEQYLVSRYRRTRP